MARKYSLFSAIPRSFMSRDVYFDAINNWKGMGITYALLIALPIIFLRVQDVSKMAASLTPEVISSHIPDIPKLTLKDNVLSAEGPLPYVYKEPQGNTPIIVIDTRVQGEQFNIEEFAQSIGASEFHGLVVNSDKVTQYELENANSPNKRIKKESVIRFAESRSIQDMEITKEKLQEVALVSVNYVAMASKYILPIFSMIYYMNRNIIFGIFTLVVAAMASKKLTFAQGCRLAAISTTPIMLLKIFLYKMQMPMPGGSLGTLLLLSLIVFFVMKGKEDVVESEAV